MTIELKGPFDRIETDDFLAATRVPLRLAAVTGSGRPLLVSLWFRWAEDSFWCATPADADIARILRARPDCAFEVSLETPPYAGIRGQGRAEILAGGKPLLRDLLIRYGGDPDSEFGRWLLGREAAEAVIRIRPDRLMSWDFSERMRGAFDEVPEETLAGACISSHARVAR